MAVDISRILQKLFNAGLVKVKDGGYCGDFSMEKDSHLLDEEELKVWIHVLHQGTSRHNSKCTDIHRWNIEFMNNVEA